ncbi:MAG: hypothetical protein K2X27_00710 [Candidatus Obscuribacterales bacterium]|nr:hypothetical protein [Candidatus Obscuribacterales bacterium]
MVSSFFEKMITRAEQGLKALILLLSFAFAGSASFAQDLQSLQDAYQKAPGNKTLVKQYGLALLAAGKNDESSKIFESAADANVADAELRFLYGETLFRLRKYPEASIELKRAYKLDSSNASYAVRAGESLLAAKRFDDLNELVNTALQKNPDSVSKITLEWLQKQALDRDKSKLPAAILGPS